MRVLTDDARRGGLAFFRGCSLAGLEGRCRDLRYAYGRRVGSQDRAGRQSRGELGEYRLLEREIF